MEFERPTPRQRLDELRWVAREMGNNPPVSVVFRRDGLVQASIGIPVSFPQDLILPVNTSETIRLEQKRSEEGVSKHRAKTQPSMKANQERHSQNLSGLNGWYNGRYYANGQPMERKESNTSGRKKNGNGRH